jgi:5'-nucleotidase
MKDHPPDLVVSGINRGGNMGEDVTYSGTVAAAMEATLLGVPAIALSQAVGVGKRPHWSTAERYTPEILDRLVRASWPSNVLINVNFPDRVASDVQGYRVVSQGRRKPGGTIVEGSDPAGRPYYWIGSMRDYEEVRPGTDLEATSDGAIAVTPLHLDLTHRPTVQDLKDAIE